MTALVGLSGYARSGKDSAAQILLGYGWQRRSFADRLREFLLALDPIVGEEHGARLSEVLVWCEDAGTVTNQDAWEIAKDYYPEVRSLLQRCGTEAGRKVLGEDVWVDATLDDLPDSTQPPVVVTDVRFENEARAIRGLGGKVFRIERPGIGPKVSADGSIHASETALDGWTFDAVLQNDGTLRELHDKVLHALHGVPVA